MRRKVDVVVISDVHLGTVGAKAQELIAYLQSIAPRILVLNGDIIDLWRLSKSYWSSTHTEALNEIIELSAAGTEVHYLTGNHDDSLRKLSDFKMGNFELKNRLILEMNGQKACFFHGDAFDISIRQARWLAKFGARGYDMLLLLNGFVNKLMGLAGMEKVSFSKVIKDKVKSSVKKLDDFEATAAALAIEKGYGYLVCGHTHQACIKEVTNKKGSVVYLNSGDWVESMTALEYHDGEWSLYEHSRHGKGLIAAKKNLNKHVLEIEDIF